MKKDVTQSTLPTNAIPPASAEFFAYHQYKDYVIFSQLVKIESNRAFRKILTKLIEQEYTDFKFWLQFCEKKIFTVPFYEVFFFTLLRRIFGLTFTAKFLERDEGNIIGAYEILMNSLEEPLRSSVAEILEREREHEQILINQFKEGKVEFLGSIILGLNDGLVELGGALVGFTFTISHTRTVAVLGCITGIAAAFSMSASAYLQARYDRTKKPIVAAMYTGVTYLIVVCLLIAPFFIMETKTAALSVLGCIIALIIAVTSFYASVVFDRKFFAVAREMVLLSVGVAFLTFVLARVLQTFVLL